MADPWDMARTDEPKTAPEVRPLGVTVLPSFEATPKPHAVEEPAERLTPAPAAFVPAAAPTKEAHHPSHLHEAEHRGARALLRRRTGRLVAVPDSEPAAAAAPAPTVAVEPAAAAVAVPALAPIAVTPPPPPPALAPVPQVAVDVTALQAELRHERERAEAAEAANAVLRRRLAQLDDELSQFRPRAIVPFEDNTD